MPDQDILQGGYFSHGPLGIAMPEMPLDAAQAILQRVAPFCIDLGRWRKGEQRGGA